MKSKCALPTVTMPSAGTRAGDDVLVHRVGASEGAHRGQLLGRARLECQRGQVEAAHVQVRRRGGTKSTGAPKSIGTASRSTVMPDSTTSLIALKPTHAPEKRDSAQP
jgi:hypothetical protein